MLKTNKVNHVFRRLLKNSPRRPAVKAQKKEEGPDPKVCLNLEDKCMVNPQCGCPKVVIVGGGMAGLSAAQRLFSCGIGSVTILESSNRLGGRVMSCRLGDSAVEVGCCGVKGGFNISNPLFGLALTVGDGDIDKVLKEAGKEATFFLTSDGNAISEYEAEELLFEHMLRESSTLGMEKTSLLHFLALRIQQELHNYPEEERYNAQRLLFGMLNELRGNCGGNLTNISAPLFGIRKEVPGPFVKCPQGILCFFAPLLQAIPYHRIFQRKEVTRIEWKENISEGIPRVNVHTGDWNCYEADYVIITLPIGVLKEKAAEIFDPPLPADKLSAICAIGCGVVNKIAAEYGEPWWGGTGCRIRLALSPEEVFNERDWTRGIHQITALSRTVIEVKTNGPEALMLEQCTEEEIALELTRFFRKLLRDNTIPFPHHIIVARWGSSPNCKGSVVTMTVDSTEDHLQELMKPIPETPVPCLLFAGDATDPTFFGTLTGARLSGLREAERILEFTRTFDGPPKASC